MTKIMLVEDDNNLREIYQARLAAEGFEIVSSSDGEAALAMAAKEKPDLIISDVMMPKISGFEMLDILRNTEGLKNVKVIMLTALGQAEDSARANSLGADRYLVKSQVTLEDIVKAAHELLDGGSVAPTASAAAPATPAPVVDEPAAPEPALAPVQDPPAAAPVPEPVAELALPAPDAETSEAPSTAIPVAEPPEEKLTTTIPVIEAPSNPQLAASPATPTTESAPEEPTAGPADTSAAEGATAAAAPQTSASEEASIKEQIDSFINTQAPAEAAPTPEPVATEPKTPAPAAPDASGPTVTEPAPTPASATAAPPVVPINVEAFPSDDDVAEPKPETMPTYSPPVISSAGAVPSPTAAPAAPNLPTVSLTPEDDLLAGAAEDLSAAAPNTPTEQKAAPSSADDSSSSKKKVISPLGSIDKPDINQLLAVEEAKAAAGQAAASTAAAPAPGPNVDAYGTSQAPRQQPSSDVDPNSISL